MNRFVFPILFCILSIPSFGQITGKISTSLNYQTGNTETMAITGKVDLDTKFSNEIESNLNLQTNYGEQFGTVFDRIYKGSFELDVMLLWEYSDMVGIDPISKPMVSFRTRLKKKLESGMSTRLVLLMQKYLTGDVYRMTSTFSMSYPVYKSLSFLFTAEHRYETVQVQGVKPNDFSTMFGLEFGI